MSSSDTTQTADNPRSGRGEHTSFVTDIVSMSTYSAPLTAYNVTSCVDSQVGPIMSSSQAPTINLPSTQLNHHYVQPSIPDPDTMPNNRRGKKKNQKVSPFDDVNSTFLQKELSTAQARICQLDAEVEDKDKRISILKSHMKSLEEKLDSSLYQTYFQPSRNKENFSNQCCSQHSCQGQARQHHQGCHTTSHQNPCCATHCCLQNSSPSNASSLFTDSQFSEIKEGILEIKDILNNMFSYLTPTNKSVAGVVIEHQKECANNKSPVSDPHSSAQSEDAAEETLSPHEESFASVESFIPDFQDEAQALNANVLTSQPLLMHQLIWE